jgi:hypothetical protein
MTRGYQPRWLAFAAWKGQPAESKELRTPDYLAFLRQMEIAYAEENGLTIRDIQSASQQEDFTAFIWQKALNGKEAA